MSRIGKQPIAIPNGVTITVDSSTVSVKGPKGELQESILEGVKVKNEEDKIIVTRDNDGKISKANHGLMRTLINNMVIGVTEGYSKKLEITGVGFRHQVQGQTLKMSLGFSHEIGYKLPEGIQATSEQNVITISGIDKQLVGQVAAEIRGYKKPEPYKGKGVAYVGERILRKSGKSGKE